MRQIAFAEGTHRLPNRKTPMIASLLDVEICSRTTSRIGRHNVKMSIIMFANELHRRNCIMLTRHSPSPAPVQAKEIGLHSTALIICD